MVVLSTNPTLHLNEVLAIDIITATVVSGEGRLFDQRSLARHT